jgi:endoglucanase
MMLGMTRHRRPSPRLRAAAAVVLLGALVAGCSGDGESAAPGPSAPASAETEASAEPTASVDPEVAAAERKAERQAKRAAKNAAKQAARQAAKQEARKAKKAAARQERRELRAVRADNPLVGRPWGNYYGDGDQAWRPYESSSGETRDLLGRIVLQPRSKWFGAWIPDGEIEGKVRDYIANAQDGDPDALVQLATFRMEPWEHAACRSVPSAAQAAGYRAWTDGLARGIGDAHVAITLQADGPFALCAPGGSRAYSDLIRYSAQVLGKLPNAAVYIDAGAEDWLQGDVDEALDLLIPAGVQYVRGFSMNNTHYNSTELEVEFGAKVVEALAARGIDDKHFVVNTSSNGKPFRGYTYAGKGHFDNADVCRSLDDTTCVTLGIPPTTRVADPAWGMSAENRISAAKYADGYLWIGRPWLFMQADPFDLQRALQLVRTWPYARYADQSPG